MKGRTLIEYSNPISRWVGGHAASKGVHQEQVGGYVFSNGIYTASIVHRHWHTQLYHSASILG